MTPWPSAPLQRVTPWPSAPLQRSMHEGDTREACTRTPYTQRSRSALIQLLMQRVCQQRGCDSDGKASSYPALLAETAKKESVKMFFLACARRRVAAETAPCGGGGESRDDLVTTGTAAVNLRTRRLRVSVTRRLRDPETPCRRDPETPCRRDPETPRRRDPETPCRGPPCGDAESHKTT